MTTCAVCGYEVGHAQRCCYRQSPPGGTPNRPPDSLEVKAVLRGAASRSEQAAAPCQNCAAAEARAEAWRKAASDMLEVEIEARDKERLREHFRKTEALTRDAAASGRALHATAEDLAIVMRGRAQPAAGPAVNPPVASADPELAKLLAEAETAVDCYRMLCEDQGRRNGHRVATDLLYRLRAALSRLAGQAATKEEPQSDARRLRAALEAARSAIHRELCGTGHAAECDAALDALTDE
jgi:hypothetical protein